MMTLEERSHSPRLRDAAPLAADPNIVGPYLASVFEDARWAECEVSLIAGGKSNLTYFVSSDAGSVVLRRPPRGHILPKAHDMSREHRIMAALVGSSVPVPRMLAFCADPGILGQPFYVMERIAGHVCREQLPPGYADRPDQRHAIAVGLVSVLAELHAIDPASVGLSGLGRVDGFLARQVRRWGQQWEATGRTDNGAVKVLGRELAASVPGGGGAGRAGIVHGDYRLDNTLLHPSQVGAVAAVLDWELATLGDPLADLGLLLVYWSQGDDDPVRRAAQVVPSATSLPGFPSRAEVAALYAERTGTDLADLAWAEALGFYKLAIVCAGIVARAEGGAMEGGGFDVADCIGPLVELGRATLATGELH